MPPGGSPRPELPAGAENMKTADLRDPQIQKEYRSMMRKFLFVLAAAAALQLSACGGAAGTVSHLAEGLGLFEKIGGMRNKAESVKEKADNLPDTVKDIAEDLVSKREKGKEDSGKTGKSETAGETGKSGTGKAEESTAAAETTRAEATEFVTLEETEPQDVLEGYEEEELLPENVKLPEIADQFFTVVKTRGGKWECTAGYLLKNTNPDAAFSYVPMNIQFYAKDGKQISDTYRGHGGVVLPGETVPVYYWYHTDTEPARAELVLSDGKILDSALTESEYPRWIEDGSTHLSDRITVDSYEVIAPEKDRHGRSEYWVRGKLKAPKEAKGYCVVYAVFMDASGHCVHMGDGPVSNVAKEQDFEFTLNIDELPKYDHIDFYVYEGPL